MREMRVARTRAELATALDNIGLPGNGAVVLTMGALHDGHVALIRAARERVGPSSSVIVTIFVNPLQFGANEDLSRYPRSLEHDLETCIRAGVDLVFAPSVEEMYPSGETTVRVDPGDLGGVLEGAVRPGHFAGMLTIVLKLLNLTRADLTFFGEKDYQQLVLVRRMSADLDLGVEVVGVSTARADDGVALSSRNAYLNPDERRSARLVPKALAAATEEAKRSGDAKAICARATAVLESDPALHIDYVAITDLELGPVTGPGPARLLIAARLGRTRLLDNASIDIAQAAS